MSWFHGENSCPTRWHFFHWHSALTLIVSYQYSSSSYTKRSYIIVEFGDDDDDDDDDNDDDVYTKDRKPDRQRDKVSSPIQRLTTVDKQRVFNRICLNFCWDQLEWWIHRCILAATQYTPLKLLNINLSTLNLIFMESLRRICLGLLYARNELPFSEGWLIFTCVCV